MKIKRMVQFILSVLLTACVTAQLAVGAIATDSYAEYKSKNANTVSTGEKLKINGSDFSACSDSTVSVGKDGAITLPSNKVADYKFNVPSDSVYNIYLSYAALDPNKSNVRLGIMLDGEYPFDKAASLNFPIAWNNATDEFNEDYMGNQLTPKQVAADGYFTYPAKDDTGIEIKPYEFFLSAGTHTVSVVAVREDVKLNAVTLSPAENEPAYEEYSKQYSSDSKNDAGPVILQGEEAINKTSYAIIPKSDTLNSDVKPSDPKRNMLNYIGGSSWQSIGEQLSWKFNAEKDGFYKISFRYKQSESVNCSSFRHLTIDGKTPFAEAREVEFEYSAKWQYSEFGNGEAPYLIWLTEGEHILTLEVTLGETTSDYFNRLSEIAENLNDVYLNIIKITGVSPDLNRDYELFKQIPDLQDNLNKNYELLRKLTDDVINDNGGKTNEMAAAFENMLRVIKNMIDAPYSAQDYIKNYYSAYSTLSTWLQDMKEMPLALDYVTVSAENSDFDDGGSFFSGLKYRVLRFISSFSSDYVIEFDEDDVNSITVWTTEGRDQVSALDALIKQDFTPKTGINVNLKIVATTLINGLMSNTYPDVLLGMSRTDPVNYGIRNALYDLRNFDDYDEVAKRFMDGADIPYTYGGSTYALPQTQGFNVMFYRTDIMQELNLSIPKTWSEFIKASVTVQRNNMEVYIPYTSISTTTVNSGIGSIGLFPTLMLQNKLSLYNDEETATAINTPEAISVFDSYIKMYTNYKIQKTADFYNRFRMGIMPLGICGYTTYFNFVQMAPEIQGKYSMALVPANDETGSRAVAGGGTGCVIVKKSTKYEASWEFLKWFTSAEIQTEYSRRVESILGLVGRISTANVEALNNMDWDSEQLAIINEQWKLVEEIPEIPGSYYLIRSIDQAYWSVINGNENSKDALARWSASADAEIERKYREYGKK